LALIGGFFAAGLAICRPPSQRPVSLARWDGAVAGRRVRWDLLTGHEGNPRLAGVLVVGALGRGRGRGLGLVWAWRRLPVEQRDPRLCRLEERPRPRPRRRARARGRGLSLPHLRPPTPPSWRAFLLFSFLLFRPRAQREAVEPLRPGFPVVVLRLRLRLRLRLQEVGPTAVPPPPPTPSFSSSTLPARPCWRAVGADRR
jgi:hypothetical protein